MLAANKSQADGKILAAAENQADGKFLAARENQADGKILAAAENQAGGKILAARESLRDLKSPRLVKYWRNWKAGETGKAGGPLAV
jgi:hypothetical protein